MRVRSLLLPPLGAAAAAFATAAALHAAERPPQTILFATPGGDVVGLVTRRSDGRGRRVVTKLFDTSFLGVAWSPDGRRIAFGTGRGLFVVSARGTLRRRIAPGLASSPAWSHDGRRIAFVSGNYAAEGQAVDVVNPDGSGLTQVGPREQGYRDLSWARGSRSLLLTVQSPGAIRGGAFCPHVAVMSLSGTQRALPGADCSFEPSWSRAGDRVAFVGTVGDVNVVIIERPDGAASKQLTKGPDDLDPTWAPSGGTIGVTHVPARAGGAAAVELVPAAGGPVRSVVRSARFANAIVGWSPDGSWISLVRYDPVEDFDHGALLVVRPSGRDARKLAAVVALDTQPAWRPGR